MNYSVLCPICGEISGVDNETELCTPCYENMLLNAPCSKCGGEIGHRINCPDGIAFTSRELADKYQPLAVPEGPDAT